MTNSDAIKNALHKCQELLNLDRISIKDAKELQIFVEENVTEKCDISTLNDIVDLAYDINFYQPDNTLRFEDFSLFDEVELRLRIRKILSSSDH